MRRFLLLAVTSAAIGSLAAPGVSGAQLPQDSVTGSAATGEGRLSVQFAFDARSGPSGENPTGSVVFDALLIDLGPLEVSCLTVSGNRASMIVLISSPSPAAPAGVLISVEDNDGAAEDRLAWSFLTSLPTGCPAPSGGGEPILAGDITITDAQPSPTSKNQCKNGAWRNYGVFRNQGDCVSFVATGAKNPPSES